MTLKIIGSGFGRTGTMSTKLALEQLGFGPCHHMLEVMQSPAQQAYWAACADGAKMDWAQVFDGFTTQVDFPGAAVWEQLILAFPNAKVLHTERPEDEWWASYSKTIGKAFAHRKGLPVPPPIAALLEKMDRLLIQELFGGLDKKRLSRRTGATTKRSARRSRQASFWCLRLQTAGTHCASSLV